MAQPAPYDGKELKRRMHGAVDALKHDFAVVTTNARDFVRLLDVDIHPGLIILRESGLSRAEQWERLDPVIRYLADSADENPLMNRLIEVRGVGQFEIREIA